MEPRPFIFTLLILLLPVYGLPKAHAPSQDLDSPASTPAPNIGCEEGGKNSGSSSSSKVNILAAVLVTGSSLMVFLAFKYSICGFARSSESSTGSQSENESIHEDDDVEASTVPNNVVSSGNTTGVIVESKKKKPISKFAVESIDKFTVLADFDSLTRNNKVVVSCRSCSVCLCEFRSESEIRVLPSCRHFFHPDCIDVWLVSNMTCPVCRRNVIPSGGEVGSSTGE